MGWKKSVLILLTCSILLAGCNKDNRVVSGAELDQWQEQPQNALIQFIPADTAGYSISTRHFTLLSGSAKQILHPLMASFQEVSYRVLDDYDEYARSQSALYEQKSNVPRVFIEDLFNLIFDYQQYATMWGMDPDGRVDRVLYVNDVYPVFKMTLVDDQKLNQRLEQLWKYMADNVDFKILPADNGSHWYVVNVQSIVCNDSDLAEFFDCGENNMFALPDTFALNVSEGVFTATVATVNIEVIGSDEAGDLITDRVLDMAQLNVHLKRPSEPLDFKLLHIVDDRYEIVSMFHWANYYERLLKKFITPSMRNMLLRSDNDAIYCLEEPLAQLKEVPQVFANTLIEKAGVIHVESDLVIKSTNVKKMLSQLANPNYKLTRNHTLMELYMNMSLDKIVDVMNYVSNELSNSNIQCEPLYEIWNDSLSSIYQILDDSEYLSERDYINGFGIALYNIDPEFEDFSQFSFAASLNGLINNQLEPLILSMQKMDPKVIESNEENAQMQPMTIHPIDFSMFVSVPLMNVLKNENTTMFMATTDVDLIKLAKKQTIYEDLMFEMNMSHDMVSLLQKNQMKSLEEALFDEALSESDLRYLFLKSVINAYQALSYDYKIRVKSGDKGLHLDLVLSLASSEDVKR